MKLEPGKLYRSKNNHSVCFVLISLGELAEYVGQDMLYSNGCKAFFPSIGRVVPQPIWSDDEWEELETP